MADNEPLAITVRPPTPEREYTVEDVPVFDAFKFTPESFQEGVKEQGLSNLTAAIIDLQAEIAPKGLFSYETLKDGTAPLLDLMPGFSDYASGAKERQLTDEQMLPFFTNVQDFGGGDNAVWLAMLDKAKRTAPKSVGGFAGAVKGAQYAAKLPVPHPLLKLGVIGIGTTAGYLFGDYLGSEASEFAFGKEYPVTPSLQAAVNAAETATYGISFLGTPWALPTKEGAIGAVRFLDNWKKVTQGTAKSAAGKKGYFDPNRMAELIAAEEALGAKAFSRAMQAKSPTGNLLQRFVKPDPRKGPLSARFAGGVERGVVESAKAARRNPYATAFYEALAITGSTAGSFGAEVAFPGSPTARIGGELVGGFLPPLVTKPILVGLEKMTRGTFNAISDTLSGEAKVRFEKRMSTDAAKRLLGAMENSDEVQQNPELIDMAIRLLGEDLVDANGKPIADASISAFFAAKGSPELARVWARIEQELGRTSDELSVASAKGREAYIQGAKNAIISAAQSGDVEALQASAFVAQRLFEDTIANSLNKSVSRLNAAAEKVMNRPRTGGPKLNLAKKLHEVLDAQLKATKQTESVLWNAIEDLPMSRFVDKNGEELALPNFLAVLEEPMRNGGVKSASKSGNLDFRDALGSNLVEEIEEFQDYFSRQARGELTEDDVNPFTTAVLWDIRGQILDKAQYFRNQGKPQLALKMDNFARAALTDLLNAPEDFGQAYNIARAYTKARNDVYTRSFLGDLEDTTKEGGLRIAPEALIDKLFQGGSNATYLRIQDIINANKFVLGQNIEGGARRAASIHQTLGNIVRDQQRKIMDSKTVKYVDPETGETITEEALVVNPKKLQDYLEAPETQELFRLFPQIKDDLADAATAQKTFDALGPELKLLRESDSTKAFMNVLESNTENPASAVAIALRSKKPAASMNELLALAKRNEPVVGANGIEYSPEQVMQGFRTAILDWAITRAGGTGYAFNPRAMQDALFGSVKGADPKAAMRLSSWMIDNGVMDKEHLGMIQKALKEMINVEEAFMSGNVENVLFKKPSGAKLFQARMIGATLGARSQQAFDNLLKKIGLGGGGGMGGGLVAASEGSKQTLNLFFRMPEAARVRVMGELMQNKRALASFIQEAQTAGQQKGMFNRMKSILTGFGMEQVGRRSPYIGRAVSEEIESDDTVTPPSYIETGPQDDEVEVIKESSVQVPIEQPPLPSQPAAPTTSVASAAPVQPGPITPPPAASGPVDRSRYAAMFPTDIASGMIRQRQGIGSFMG